MNIRTQLRASTFTTTFFLVLFIVILLIIASSVWQATDRLKVAEQITERSFQLSLLRSEYLQHPGERAKIQWIGQSESKLRLIDEKAHLFTNDIERGLVEKLRMAAYSNRLMFAQLVRSVEQGGSDTVVQELSNQMSMRSQTGIQLAVQLSASSRQAVATAARMLVYAVFVIGLFVFIISLGTSVISRNISQTISALAKGTRTIAGGNLTYRLPETTNNELGDLSRLFNAMSTELQRSYASLEERVQKRTSELQETNRFLDAILENIPNMIFVKDAGELRFVRFNRAAEDLLGFKREKMIGKNDYDFFPQDQAVFFIGKDRLALESATVTDIPEEPIDTVHQGKRWLHTRKISIRDENGKPQYLLGISEDITEIRQKEAKIAATLQALDKTALVSITDKEGIITYVNEKFLEVSKYPKEELIGSNHRIMKSGLQPQSLFVDLWQTISKGHVWRGEILNKAKDGTLNWLDTAIAPILSPLGKAEHYISIRFLITDRKKALQDIRKFQQAVASSTEAVLIIENPNDTIAFVNPAWSRLTGYPADEVMGKKMQYSQWGKTARKIQNKLEKAMQEGKPFYSDEFVLSRKDGGDYTAELRMYPVFNEGSDNQVAFYVIIHADITARKQQDKAKTEFMSLASHQLRTPLTEIRWALSSLKQEHLTREQKETVSTAHAASSHMAETIKAMLAISHVETGDMNPEPADVKLNDLITDIARLTEAEMKKKNITLTVRCPPRLTLHSDAQLLKEIVGNLLSNACKYNRPGGTVTVTATKENGRVRIDIADTGLGIPRGEQDRISEKFFRASNAIGHNQEGSGLGLHLAYSLVQLLGGTIAFTSDGRTGTVFTLSFPASV